MAQNTQYFYKEAGTASERVYEYRERILRANSWQGQWIDRQFCPGSSDSLSTSAPSHGRMRNSALDRTLLDAKILLPIG
jgi:hypothetical protein